MNYKLNIIFFWLILIMSCNFSVESSSLEQPESGKYNQRTETNRTLPSCEELNITQKQIDTAVSEAIIGIKDPWGNERDFQLLIDRIEAKLGCSLQKSKKLYLKNHKKSK